MDLGGRQGHGCRRAGPGLGVAQGPAKGCGEPGRGTDRRLFCRRLRRCPGEVTCGAAPPTCGVGTRDVRRPGRSRAPRGRAGAPRRWSSLGRLPGELTGSGGDWPYSPRAWLGGGIHPTVHMGPRLADAIRRHPEGSPGEGRTTRPDEANVGRTAASHKSRSRIPMDVLLTAHVGGLRQLPRARGRIAEPSVEVAGTTPGPARAMSPAPGG
jgi:hypothetical protein